MRLVVLEATAAAATGYPDCELIGQGLVAQPSAALTSLAFIPLGLWVIADRRAQWSGRGLLGVTILAVGVGSFLGHASASDWGREMDSLAIKLMLITFVLQPMAGTLAWSPAILRRAWLVAAAAVLTIQLALPAVANPLLGLLAVAALGLAFAAVEDHTQGWLLAGLGLLSAGAALWWLGREGGPLCAAEASLQPHGLWHILAAAGIASIYQVHRSSTA